MKTSLFAYGFRSNFLLAGLAALLLVPVWAMSFAAGTPLGTAWPPTLWHAHEMLFGFIAVAIAGFMLTAVPSWTGQKGFAGAPLVALAATWLSARLLIASSGLWPTWLPALADLAFLPFLAVLVMIPLLRSRNRNSPLLIVLALLWTANLVFHVALMRKDAPLARHALIVGIDIVLMLVTVIGGRIVPAVAQLLRLMQWRTLRTLRQPIVWILHLAYAWLPLGLALKAAALLGGYGMAAFWLHALTIGALTTMITAVMTRAALGHTGRPLVLHPSITVAYALLTAAAVTRVFGLSLSGLGYPAVILWAALFWTLAFALFVGVYAPILWAPRADGKAG